MFNFEMALLNIAQVFIFIIVVLIYFFIILASIILHELMHAKAADIMGDPTPRIAGRLTLNPFVHLDPIGTLLPIFMLLTRMGIVFGWAKPVPINPYNFRDPKKGMMYTGLAGPMTNLFIAWVLGLILKFTPEGFGIFPLITGMIFPFAIRLNIILAVFNLLPVPPLDGSHILAGVLPERYAEFLDHLQQFGFLILIAILFLPGTSDAIIWVVNLIYRLFV